MKHHVTITFDLITSEKCDIEKGRGHITGIVQGIEADIQSIPEKAGELVTAINNLKINAHVADDFLKAYKEIGITSDNTSEDNLAEGKNNE